MEKIVLKLAPPEIPGDWRSLNLNYWQLGKTSSQWLVVSEETGQDNISPESPLYSLPKKSEDNRVVIVNYSMETIDVEVITSTTEFCFEENGIKVWRVYSSTTEGLVGDILTVNAGEEKISLPVKLLVLPEDVKLIAKKERIID